MTTAEREALIEQSVLQAWTLQELGDKLGVTRERARQLLKKRGLDKLRVNRNLREPKEKPVKFCARCGGVYSGRGYRYCSVACRADREREYHRDANRLKYQTDPAVRERQARYRSEHTEQMRAASKMFQDWYKAFYGVSYSSAWRKKARAMTPLSEQMAAQYNEELG